MAPATRSVAQASQVYAIAEAQIALFVVSRRIVHVALEGLWAMLVAAYGSRQPNIYPTIAQAEPPLPNGVALMPEHALPPVQEVQPVIQIHLLQSLYGNANIPFVEADDD